MNEEVWGGGGSRSGGKGVEFERRVRAREDAEVIQGSFEFEFEDANDDLLSVCLCVVMLARQVSLTYSGCTWQHLFAACCDEGVWGVLQILGASTGPLADLGAS